MAFIGPYQQYAFDGGNRVWLTSDTTKQATAINNGLLTVRSEAVADAKAYADAEFAADRGRLGAIESKNTEQDAAIAAARTGATTDAAAYVDAKGYVPAWKPNTAYVANQRVISPAGDFVTAKTNFTSSANYVASNWNPSYEGTRLKAVEDLAAEHEAKALLYRGLLGTTHLDTITEPGFYLQTTLGNATVENGYPPEVSRGFLFVYRAPGSTLVYHHYVSTFRGKSFMREQYAGTWIDWVPVGAGAAAPPPDVVFTDQDITDLAMAQIAGNDSSVYRATFNSNFAVELPKQLPISEIPRQVIAGTNMATARPSWPGPVYWIVTTPGAVPTNKAAGDLVLEVTAGSI